MKILDRAVGLELLGPFGFGVAAFTTIMLASTVLFNLVTLMVRFGLPPWLVAEILVLKLPEMAFYSFPMAMLLATLLAFGRMSADGEITALKAAGVSLYRVMAPVIALALAVSLGTIALSEYAVPPASGLAKALLYEASHHQRLPVERDHVSYQEMQNGELARLFYARHFDGERMQDVVVQEFEHNRLVRIVQAQEARPVPLGWRFARGVLYQVDDRGEYRYTVRFDSQVVQLGSALLGLGRENREPVEMNARELHQHIGRLAATGQAGPALNELSVQWHQKFAVPFASLVFALVGAPLGLRPTRASNGIGLGISVLVIFLYYVIMFVSMALGQTGALAPVLAAWLPNAVAGAIGGVALWQVARR